MRIAAIALVVVAISFALEGVTPTHAEVVFTVNDKGDAPDASPGNGVCATADGVCTVRAAIQEANALAGPDRMHFNLPGDCVATEADCFIIFDALLPRITGELHIDGLTQPGATTPRVMFNWAFVSPFGEDDIGLDFGAAGGSVEGILFAAVPFPVLASFPTRIERNWFSLFADGGVGIPAPPRRLRVAIDVANGSTVRNNVIGLSIRGINVRGNNNVVTGNTIARDGNGVPGVATLDAIIVEGAGNTIGSPEEPNLITAARTGILVGGPLANRNTIQANRIGTNREGTARQGTPPQYGILISGGASQNQVGGTRFEGNVIANSAVPPVDADSSFGIAIGGAGTDRNDISGNWVGVGVDGAANFNGVGTGIRVSDGAADNDIGGSGFDVNTIGGYSVHGIALVDAERTFVQGNGIGVGPGARDFGNGFAGIFISGGGGHQIGGVGAGEANVIRFNRVGVVLSGPTDANRIERNVIYGNDLLAIDLIGPGSPIPEGVTQNDPTDADTGPNGLQNFPVLTTAVTQGDSIKVTGTLRTTPGIYSIELFANTQCDASGYGEGQYPQQQFGVVVPASGVLEFERVIPGSDGIPFLAATATGAGTSEFSNCIRIENPPAPPPPTTFTIRLPFVASEP